MCAEAAEAEDHKKNGILHTDILSGIAHVQLGTRMQMEKMGALQFISTSEGPRRHYPNVDVFKCPLCGHRVVHE